MPELTSLEKGTLTLTGILADNLRKIIGDGSAAHGDWAEMVFYIHGVQNAILAQAAARAYPNDYRLLGGDPIEET